MSTKPGAPLCRWRRDDLIVDVMPVDERIRGFSNRWYPSAIETAQRFDIAGHDVRVVTPALFIATKLDAFHGRGNDDVLASHDLEDIIAVVDGRPEILNDIAAAGADVRGYIGTEIRAPARRAQFHRGARGLPASGRGESGAAVARRGPPWFAVRSLNTSNAVASVPTTWARLDEP